MTINWFPLDQEFPEPEYQPGECHTPKCQRCGRFTKRLTLVWTGGPEPEPDYEVGDCCKDKR